MTAVLPRMCCYLRAPDELPGSYEEGMWVQDGAIRIRPGNKTSGVFSVHQSIAANSPNDSGVA